MYVSMIPDKGIEFSRLQGSVNPFRKKKFVLMKTQRDIHDGRNSECINEKTSS